jgi:glutathione peroxidase
MKSLVSLLLLAFTLNTMAQNSIYDFKVPALNGGEINFADYKGKKILIVNTASECGYTPQYKQLQELWESKKDELRIIGFPANNYGKQEPGTNTEIATFCQKNYGVTFPMAAKASVNGDDTHPLFKWLLAQENPDFIGPIKWNFEKILIDENGQVIRRFRSGADPLGEEILGAL